MNYKKLINVLLLLVPLFSFVPKIYADDPCAIIGSPPILYQINRTPTQATLFFTPVKNDQVTSYTIIYGLSSGDERYSLKVNQGVSTGAISYTINDLQPGVPYYYNVKGSTSCTESPWSGWQVDKPTTKGASTVTPGIPVTGPNEAFFGFGVFSLLLLSSGVGLFAYSKRKN